MREVADEAERARIAILCAQREILIWNLDPTPAYTPSVRRGADEAVRLLEEAGRRTQAALDRLRAQIEAADGGRTTADSAGQERTPTRL